MPTPTDRKSEGNNKAFDEALKAIDDGKAAAHALWVLLSDEHERDGYALKPMPWEGPGEYQHVVFDDGRDGLVRIPVSRRVLPIKVREPKVRIRVVNELSREDASGRTLETGAGQQETADAADLVARLRKFPASPIALTTAAADEIERLRATAAAARAMMEALIQARGALLLDAMHGQDGKPYGTTVVALEMIDAALSLARSSGIKGE